MSTENKILKVDRIEDGIVVAVSDDGEKYSGCLSCDVHESDIISAEVNTDGELLFAKVLTQETKNKKRELWAKLRKLFKK